MAIKKDPAGLLACLLGRVIAEAKVFRKVRKKQRHKDTKTQRHKDTKTQRHKDTDVASPFRGGIFILNVIITGQIK